MVDNAIVKPTPKSVLSNALCSDTTDQNSGYYLSSCVYAQITEKFTFTGYCFEKGKNPRFRKSSVDLGKSKAVKGNRPILTISGSILHVDANDGTFSL